MSNKMMWSVLAKASGDGVEMETDLAGSIIREFVDAKSRIQDKALRQWLIDQGWTSPEMSSAAPDMYRALRGLLDIIDWPADFPERIKAAEAALAKADGEQQ